ncbi:MAG: hypothetical protein ACLPVI_09670 [Dehalococcoidales bacterium]
MSIFHSVFAARLIVVLGIMNLVTGFLLLFSCRVVPAFSLTRNLMHYNFYKKFYRYHSYLWLVFWISVTVHVVFAINFLGWPF